MKQLYFASSVLIAPISRGFSRFSAPKNILWFSQECVNSQDASALEATEPANLVGRAGLEPATNGLKDRLPIGPKYLSAVMFLFSDCGKQLGTTARRRPALLRAFRDFPHYCQPQLAAYQA
jgi:hypothetical protein